MSNLIEILFNPDFDPREVYKFGSWFLVSEAAIRKEGTDQIFARDKADKEGRRPTVLASPLGPNAVLFPRSTKGQASGQGAYQHEAHYPWCNDRPRCGINRNGWVLRVPCNVSATELTPKNWSCVEPEASGLNTVLEQWLR